MRISITHGVSAAALALLGAGGAVAAEGPRYTYAEIGYATLDFDEIAGFEADGEGYTLAGSVAVTDMFHVFAGYLDGEVDVENVLFGSFDVDWTQTAAGLGVNWAASDTVDVVGRVAWLNAEAEASAFGVSASEDEDGFGLSAGVRAMVAPTFELNGAVVYSDYGSDVGDDTSVELGAVWSFTDMFALTAGAAFAGDYQQVGIGVRAYFGSR